MQYKASLDNSTKAITALVLILIVAVVSYRIKLQIGFTPDISTALAHSGIIILLGAVVIGSYLYAPTAYRVDDDFLTIVRPVYNKKIKMHDIIALREMTDTEVFGAIRALGNGGLFGYYGKYYVPKLGWATFYATQRRNRILITTQQGKKIMLTPDDLAMLDEMKAKLSANKV